MSELSGFFKSKIVNGKEDKLYLASDFANYFSMFISNGVFASNSNELLVTALEDGMKVNVSVGNAWINGYWYKIVGTPLQLQLANANGTQDRIDLVVLRWDDTDRSIKAVIKQGTPSSSPEAPDLIRTTSTYEMCIAKIFVAKGSTMVHQANITDTRLDKNLCGIVGALVEQWDMTGYGQQLDNYIEQFELNSQEEFTAWFNEMKNQLSNDAAGHLQNQIDAIETLIDGMSSDITQLKADVLSLTEIVSAIGKAMHPVNSIYISSVDVDPATLFGGTWEKYATGRMLMGVDPDDPELNVSGKLAGEKEHTLTWDETCHSKSDVGDIKRTIVASCTTGFATGTRQIPDVATKVSGTEYLFALKDASSDTSITTVNGTVSPHNNLPPIITTYIYRRIA